MRVDIAAAGRFIRHAIKVAQQSNAEEMAAARGQPMSIDMMDVNSDAADSQHLSGSSLDLDRSQNAEVPAREMSHGVATSAKQVSLRRVPTSTVSAIPAPAVSVSKAMPSRPSRAAQPPASQALASKRTTKPALTGVKRKKAAAGEQQATISVAHTARRAIAAALVPSASPLPSDTHSPSTSAAGAAAHLPLSLPFTDPLPATPPLTATKSLATPAHAPPFGTVRTPHLLLHMVPPPPSTFPSATTACSSGSAAPRAAAAQVRAAGATYSTGRSTACTGAGARPARAT